MEREAKLGLALSAALALLVFAGVMGVKTIRNVSLGPEPARSERPLPEDVVAALQDDGLVRYAIPIEEWANTEYGTIPPKGGPTKNGVHFSYVGQFDESNGGDGLVFESQENLGSYVEQLGPGNGSDPIVIDSQEDVENADHIIAQASGDDYYYREGLLLSMLDGSSEYGLPASQADCFGRVFKEIVQEKTGDRGAEESIALHPCGLY